MMWTFPRVCSQSLLFTDLPDQSKAQGAGSQPGKPDETKETLMRKVGEVPCIHEAMHSHRHASMVHRQDGGGAT